jgi:peroxiredoxin
MRHALLLLFLLLATSLILAAGSAAELRYGTPFPETGLRLSDSTPHKNFLGIDNPARFTLSDVRGDIVLVEFMNVHCPHCQMQAPSYNELYKEIEASPAGKGRVKMLGIAVGNLPQEVEAFQAAYQVQFPIVADSDFTIWRSIDGEATPYTVYVRQTKPGQPGIVAGSHLGLNTHYEALLAELLKLADTSPDTMLAAAVQVTKKQDLIAKHFSQDELEYRVRSAFVASGGGIRDFAKLSLRSGRQVYAAQMQTGENQRVLFAEVVSRQSVCDICHDVLFIYIFDLQGQVYGFESLQLTKYGNVNWTSQEIATMRGRLLGKSLLQKHRYNPQVDAISSATITSAIIIDSLNQGAALLEELHEKGF